MKIIFSRGWWVGDKNRLKSQRKKVSLKNLKLINDYYCGTVRRRREKVEDYAREMAFSIEIEQCY